MFRSRTALAAAAFDAAPSELAILAADGMILAVNEAWRRFGDDNGASARCGVGTNYLRVTDRAAEGGDEVAATVAAALLAVCAGHAPRLQLDYPCHSPDRCRWFRLRAARLPGRPDVLVVHDEITDLLGGPTG